MRLLFRGIAAGIVGTAAMTAVQLSAARLRGQPLQTPVPKRWADAPAPAQVVKKAASAIGEPRLVTREDAPRVTNVVHWGYGTLLGVLYALAARALRPGAFSGGVGFGAGVWSASYAELVPLGIYKPPWRYPAPELALDLGYHLVYGLAVAEAYERL
ncbi:MAG TPA: hypothetical protein VGL76_05195 [Gaiellaceae bacterium]